MKSRSLSAFYLTLLLTLCGISATLADQVVRYSPGQVIVKVQLNVNFIANNETVTSNNPALAAVLAEIKAKGVQEIFPADRQGSTMSRYYTIVIPSEVDVIQAVTKLSKLECVQTAQPNYVYTCNATPTDISYPEQWGLAKINAPTAWDLFTGSDQMIIAVLDSGVDWEHQDLAANIWNNTGEIPSDGVDNDNNGYVDDVHGWDFSERQYSIGYIDPQNPTEIAVEYLWKPEDSNPGVDPNNIEYQLFGFDSHGTHVAGIIGGVGNNTVSGNINIVGTMWNCKVMPLKANHFEWDVISQDWISSFYSNAIVKGIRYAADNGARVINMSFGGPSSSGIEDIALQYAYKKGVVLCASAGNDNTIRPRYPASSPNVISVAATDETDKRSIWDLDFNLASCYGPTVDISAPGTDIISCVTDNEYERWGGTSMACPFVSGAAGMILGYGETLGKKFTPGQVEYILEQSADNIAAENPGFESWLGAGRLNLANALTLAQNTHPMISSILIQSVADPNAEPEVNEHSTINLQAIAVYSNGAEENITNKVAWSLRPVRYGNFSSFEAGKFIALQVPDDREVVATATYTVNGDSFHGQRVVTILDDPNASALTITGADTVDPLSFTSYHAVYTNAENQVTDVTANVTWTIVSGAEYANFDPGQPGLLLTRISAANKLLTIEATYVNETDRRVFKKTFNIQVQAVSQQVAGLFLTAPGEIAAGSTLELKASLIMAGQSQGQDVTAASTWSASPAETGSFVEPGLFLAGNVSNEKTVTITVEYTRNGQVYTAQLDTKVIPAVAMGEVVTSTNSNADDDDQDTDSETNGIQDLLGNLTICPVAGFMTMVLMLGGLVLIREN